ncbi:MAG: glycosyltransferase [Candidatus Gottesmanbacteria bacterium]|nr:glycosyltransferase [Candidatus Gottesmanbacteria bacterium]
MKRISFVIPLYNAAASVRELTTRILSPSIPGNKEIIYTNDGSTDDTDRIVRALATKNKSIIYIQLAGNFGQHNAILTGLKFARGNIVVCLDDDLQTPPEEAVILLDALTDRDVDVVYGQYETNEDPVRRIGTRLHNLMAQVFGKPKDVTLTSFFCMTKSVAHTVSQYKGTLVYLPGLVFRATKKITSVPVRHVPRKYGRSGYTFLGLLKLWLIGVLVYLRLADIFTYGKATTVADSVNARVTSNHR